MQQIPGFEMKNKLSGSVSGFPSQAAPVQDISFPASIFGLPGQMSLENVVDIIMISLGGTASQNIPNQFTQQQQQQLQQPQMQQLLDMLHQHQQGGASNMPPIDTVVQATTSQTLNDPRRPTVKKPSPKKPKITRPAITAPS